MSWSVSVSPEAGTWAVLRSRSRFGSFPLGPAFSHVPRRPRKMPERNPNRSPINAMPITRGDSVMGRGPPEAFGRPHLLRKLQGQILQALRERDPDHPSPVIIGGDRIGSQIRQSLAIPDLSQGAYGDSSVFGIRIRVRQPAERGQGLRGGDLTQEVCCSSAVTCEIRCRKIE